MSAALAGELEPTELAIDRFIADWTAGKTYETMPPDPSILPRYRAWRERQKTRVARLAIRNGWIPAPAGLTDRLNQVGMMTYLARTSGVPVGTLRNWRRRQSDWVKKAKVEAVLAALERFDSGKGTEMPVPTSRCSYEAENARAEAVFEQGCRELGFNPEQVRTRERVNADARHLLMRYLRDRGFSLTEIARAVGLKNHTSVLIALRRLTPAAGG